MNEKEKHANDPMHGITLEMIINALVDHYGWGELGMYIKIRCFNSNPSVKSSLKFLRKTPWARKKVEELYFEMLLETKVQSEPRRDPWANCKNHT